MQHGNPTEEGLEATPGYQFTKAQGLESAQSGFAAQGLGSSGAALKGGVAYATGLADSTYNQQYQNYLAGKASYLQQNQQTFNDLASVGQLGETAAAGAGALGQTAAGAGGSTWNQRGCRSGGRAGRECKRAGEWSNRDGKLGGERPDHPGPTLAVAGVGAVGRTAPPAKFDNNTATLATEPSMPEPIPHLPNSADHAVALHDRVSAVFDKTSQSMKLATVARAGLDKLVTMGDAVEPDDVIQTVSDLVGKGHDPRAMGRAAVHDAPNRGRGARRVAAATGPKPAATGGRCGASPRGHTASTRGSGRACDGHCFDAPLRSTGRTDGRAQRCRPIPRPV